MTPSDREALLLLADVLDLCLRRACADDNTADALAVVRNAVQAWGEDRSGRREVARNLHAVFTALRLTASDAPAGAFDERYAEHE